LAASGEWLDKSLNIFNSFHERIQFTLEKSDTNSINFLDVTIIIDGQGIVFDCYRKPTFSGRYINFHSQHLIFQKRGIIYGLIDKILFLSHPKFHEQNLKKTIKLLLDNCFPLFFNFCTINKRIKQIAYSINKFNKDNKEQKQVVRKEYFTIPYVNSILESFTLVCARFGFHMSHSILNILKKRIKRGKDKLEIRYQQDVVYKITCKVLAKGY